MATIKWDEVGSRTYENGLDRGVLYLPDGSAVPWNGLTNVVEKFDKKVSAVYFDGKKIGDLPELGDFSATMKAVTYPDEFDDLEGVSEIRTGISGGDQPPKTFGLAYRTRVGNDLEGDEAGYKINLLYNVIAIPAQRTYASLTADPTLVEFEWNLTASPEDIEGIRPTAHFVIDSRETDPWLLEDLEAIFYGDGFTNAVLLPMSELIEFMRGWYRVEVIDNGDGTWTATEARAGFINVDFDGSFVIDKINAYYIDDNTWEMSDTKDENDVVQIKITYNIDETWTATTSSDVLIVDKGEGEVDILNANVVYIDEDSYYISDTIE